MNHSNIRLAQDAVKAVSITRIPGQFWVEFLPFLKYIPAWVPGTHSKKHAKYGKLLWDRVRDEPFNATKEKIVRSFNLYSANIIHSAVMILG